MLFSLGLIYRRSNVLTFEDGRSLSKLIIYITMPCLAFISFSQTQFTTNEVFTLPALGLASPVILFFISLIVSRKLNLEKRTLAIFLSSATVANLSFFLYPFFEIYYGVEGLTKLIMFDIGNTISAYVLAYFIVLRYGTDKQHSIPQDILNLLRFPPLWGIVFGIIYGLALNEKFFTPPDYLLDVIAKVGQANSFVAMIVLGVYFNWSVKQPKAAIWAIFIRMVCGMVVGALFAWILNLSGLVKLVAIIAPGMPVGLSIIVYSVQHNLDSEFAISILSLSLILGLVIIFFFMPLI